MWLSRFFVLFVIYSCMGWIYETIYCTIKWKKWENRGFLYGPICPIYGTGGAVITILMEVLGKHNISYSWWQVFLVCSIGSFFLEYGTHWGLEKLFHACWWDYSYMPLNIKGRVCLPYTLCFGAAGILVTYVVAPFVTRVTSYISPIGYEFMGLVFMGIIGMDIAMTASTLSDFDRYIQDADAAVDMHMEQFVATVGTKAGEMSEQMQAKIAEEREKYSLERMKNRFDAMSAFSMMALKRVHAFKPKPVKSMGKVASAINREKVKEFVKNHRPEIKYVRESK